MDYDQTDMPENYDRGRRQPPGVLEMWMDRIAKAVEPTVVSSIIDLGCGTGRFSEALATQFDADVVGLDPSEKMLAQARAKATAASVSFVRGSGESIPATDGSADLVFTSMAFHHFNSPDQVAKECRRVLRRGGVICVRNSLREYGSPYEAYFPNYTATLGKLPSRDAIVAPFERGGFRLIKHEAVAHKMAETLSELAVKAAFRADTTLQLLSGEDFAQGLNNIREEARTSREPVMIDIALFVFERGRS